MRYVTFEEIKSRVTIADCIEPVREAFRKYSSPPLKSGIPAVNVPKVQHLEMPYCGGSALHIKSGHVPPLEFCLVKVASTFPANTRLQPPQPSINGAILIFSTRDGVPLALLNDRAWITQIRTAAAGAIAIDLFSRQNSQVLGVIGSGVQARLQTQAAILARPSLERVLVWGRTSQNVDLFVRDIRIEHPDLEISAMTNPEPVVRNSQVVITATYAKDPIVESSWISAGTMLLAMGADSALKSEVDPRAFANPDALVIVDSKSQNEELGEVAAGIRRGLFEASRIDAELGSAILDELHWRSSAANRTTLVKLTGIAAQEIMVCDMILRALGVI